MKGDAASPHGHTPDRSAPVQDGTRRACSRLPRRLLAVVRGRQRREPARSRPAWLGRPLTARGLPMLALLLAALTLPSSLPAGLASGAATDEAARALGLSLEEWNRLHEQAWQRGRQAAAEAAGQQPVAEAVANGPGAATPSMLALPQGGDHRIPALALRAYHEAAAWAAGFRPGCGLSWSVLAGIGRLESNHGMHWGSATRFSPDGVVSPPITGPALNGRGVASIPDTDGGRWDGDRTWDRAVGPMQFIPSTWRRLGATATATASPTRTTCSTRPPAPPATCAWSAGTCPAGRGCAGPSTATTTPGPTWTPCCAGRRSMRVAWPSVQLGPRVRRSPRRRPLRAVAASGTDDRRCVLDRQAARAGPLHHAGGARPVHHDPRPPTSSSATTTSMTTSTTTLSTTATTTPSTTTGPCATTTTSTTTTAPTTTTLPPCSP